MFTALCIQLVKRKVRFSKFSLGIKFKFIYVISLLTKQTSRVSWVECRTVMA